MAFPTPVLATSARFSTAMPPRQRHRQKRRSAMPALDYDWTSEPTTYYFSRFQEQHVHYLGLDVGLA